MNLTQLGSSLSLPQSTISKDSTVDQPCVLSHCTQSVETLNTCCSEIISQSNMMGDNSDLIDSSTRNLFSSFAEFEFPDIDLLNLLKDSIPSVAVTTFMVQLVSFLVRLSHCVTQFQVGHSCFDFIISMSVGPFTPSMEDVQYYVKHQLGLIRNNVVVSQSLDENTAKAFKIFHSDAFGVVRDMILGMVSLRFFSKEVAFKVTSHLGATPVKDNLTLIEDLCLNIARLIGYSDRIRKGESFSAVLLSDNPCEIYLQQALVLVSQQNSTYVGTPIPNFISLEVFIEKLTQLVADGDTLLKTISKKNSRRAAIQIKQSELIVLLAQKNTLRSGMRRVPPVGILLTGFPGVGKSSILDIIISTFCHSTGREDKPANVFHRNSNDKFWSGYSSQPVVHLSELGSKSVKLTSTQGDIALGEFLSLVDSLPFCANMADIEHKGNVFLTPSLVIADTNNPNLNAQHLYVAHAAVMRRLLFIDVTVRESFRTPGTCALDSSAVGENPTNDYWLFTVTSKPAVDNVTSSNIIHLSGVGIGELVSFLATYFRRHESNQARANASIASFDVRKYIPVVSQALIMDVVRECNHWSDSRRVLGRHVNYVIDSFLELRILILAFLQAYEDNFLSLLRLLRSIVWLLITVISVFFVFIIPNNVILKSAGLYSGKQAIGFAWEDVSSSARDFKESFGIYDPRPQRPVKWEYRMYFCGFLAAYACIRLFKTTRTTIGQGVFYPGEKRSPVSPSEKERVNSEIARFEVDSEARDLPRREVKARPVWSEPLAYVRQSTVLYNSPSDVMKTCESNVRDVIVHGKLECGTRILGIRGNLAIINSHALGEPTPGGGWVVDILRGDKHQEKVQLPPHHVHRCEGDITLILMRTLQFKDILDYFPKEKLLSKNGWSGLIGESKAFIRNSEDIMSRHGTSQVPVTNAFTYIWADNAAGKCGTPLYANHSGVFGPIGIHSAANLGTDCCYASGIDQLTLLRWVTSFDLKVGSFPMSSQGSLRLGEPISFGVPHGKSCLNYESTEHLIVIGSNPKTAVPMRQSSEIVHSVIFDDVEKLTGVSPTDEGVERWGGAMMHAVGRGDDYRAPFNNFLRKLERKDVSLNMQVCDYIVEVLSDRFSEAIGPAAPVPIDFAQNGSRQDPFLRGISKTTSGGFGFPGKKGEWLENSHHIGYDVFNTPTIEVKQEVVKILGSYRDGQSAMPIYTLHLKDEVRSLEKIITAETRVFAMSPYDHLLVSRAYLAPFYTAMVADGSSFHSLLGINMHSADVDDLVGELSCHEHFMEGDFKSFDTTMPMDIAITAASVIYHTLRKSGYSGPALDVLAGILTDSCFPVVSLEGVLAIIPGYQPSGKYGTAEDNSLRNLVLFLYYAVVSANLSIPDVLSMTTPKYYGDDSLVGVDERLISKLNNHTFRDFCRDHYGMTYTSSLKGEELHKWLPLQKCSILKRHFVWRKDIQHWVAPLDRDSIAKALAYSLPSKVITADEQILQTCVSMARELFLYASREEYAPLRLLFVESLCKVTDYPVNVISNNFPTFDSIHESMYPNDYKGV